MPPTDHDWAVGEAREHLAILREGRYEEKHGWVVDETELDEKRLLYVSIPTRRVDGSEHPDGPYHLRLHFLRYPKRPPALLYVNPETRVFDPATDERWLPNLGKVKPPGVGVEYYPKYDEHGQLICHSMNDDWYFRGGHVPNEAAAWKAGQHTFLRCLFLHQQLQTEPYYGGRRA